VSGGVLEAMVRTDQTGVRTFFLQLLEAGVRFFAISAPPPRRDHPAVARGVPLETIAHIDGVARAIWRSWLREKSIPLVDSPPEARDGDGFLLPEFSQTQVVNGVRDAHHANSDYGRLLWPEILAHANALQAQP
jgi:hypothetical protein